MKKEPIKISDLDVQPLEDAELSVLSGQASVSDYWECCNGSDWIICYSWSDQ